MISVEAGQAERVPARDRRLVQVPASVSFQRAALGGGRESVNVQALVNYRQGREAELAALAVGQA